MKKIIFTILFLFGLSMHYSQEIEPDSISQILSAARTDAEKLKVYLQMRRHYKDRQSDKLLYYSEQALLLAEKLDDDKARADALEGIGQGLFKSGNYPQAVDIILSCIELCQNIKYKERIGYCFVILGDTYRNQQDYLQASGYYHNAVAMGIQLNDDSLQLIGISELAYLKAITKQTDSAFYWNDRAHLLSAKVNNHYLDGILDTYGVIYEHQGQDEMAKSAYLQAIDIAISSNNPHGATWFCNHLSGFYKEKGETDSSIYWAKKSISFASTASYPFNLIESAEILSTVFSSLGKYDSAYTYMLLRNQISDSLFNLDKNRQSQWLVFSRSLEEEKASSSRRVFRNRVRLYLSLAAIALLLPISAIMYKNMRRKQRDKARIEKAYTELKETQTQLVQREKMASLGELTAGIAHEIQNPLNFVNNFSDLNRELIKDLKSEKLKVKGERDEDLENQLLLDIEQNLEKINHHGKRADAIVKGMLQHSRTSSGQKESTDINALADEYLRLAYHGLRAKDKLFNTKTETDFDPSVGKINIVPQDIGRVLLNLINNAFFAVNEKMKTYDGGHLDDQVGQAVGRARPDDPRLNDPVRQAVGQGYEPAVTVITKKVNDTIQITVADNGNGIPQNIIDKIFQPFFTTKPTGQGTGLGLSLSYDIVTALGGEINVETKEGEGSKFIIQLPIMPL